jgi:hypothetical protein
MHIEKIDNLLDRIIDDFFENVFLLTTDFDKIYKEANFIKYQKDINDILKKYYDTINLEKIKEVAKNNETINRIYDTIKRYLGYYVFLTIGYNYDYDEKIYINNIVEFSKNQQEYKLKINNFFNSESNAIIVKFNKMMKNMLILFKADKNKINTLKTLPDFIETIKFLNTLDVEYIKKNLILDNIENKDKKLQCHNIIKTLIYIELYKNIEKIDLYKMLEMSDTVDDEYMYIDIVVARKQTMDYDILEKLLGPKNKNLAQEFWKMINEEEKHINLDNDEKINLLIKSKIVRPICDDFLLFSKNTEKYDKTDDRGVNIKKKEDTKINYIVNKINLTKDYYSEQMKSDEKGRSNIKKLFYQPMYNKKVILVNNNEDVQIIHKFKNMSIISNENLDYLNDLKQFMSYPYVNFKDFDKYGFSITLDKTIDVIRYVSINTEDEFKQNKNDQLQLKVGNDNSAINIVGLMIPSNKKPLQCIKSKDCLDIKKVTKNKNGFDLFMKYLYETNIGMKKHNTSVYWIFDLNTDIVNIKSEKYDQTNKFTNSEQLKKIVSVLYDNVINYTYNEITNKMKKNKNLTLYKANKIIKYYEKKIIPIKDNRLILKLIHEIKNMVVKIDNPDEDEDNDGKEHDEIILPAIFDKDKNIKDQYEKLTGKKVVQTIIINKNTGQNNDIVDEFINIMTCQHFIVWDHLMVVKKKDPTLYTELIQNFIEQYIVENEDHEHVCKSCNNLVNIKTYVTDYASELQNIIVNTYIDVSLDEIAEYEHYKVAIIALKKTIEKFAFLINLHFLMRISNDVKIIKQTIIKNIIDVTIDNLKYLSPIFKERNDKVNEKYGISKDLTDVFIFKFENSIFGYSTKGDDEYKHIKQNNMFSYTIIMLLLEISDSHIYHIGTDKKELLAFDKIYKSLFAGVKIIVNNKGHVNYIVEYKLLCYVLYVFAVTMTKYNMWTYSSEKLSDKEKQKNTTLIQKKVIFTTIDLLNSILEKYLLNKKNNDVFNNVCNKIFFQINTLYKNNNLYDNILTDNLIDGKITELSTKKYDIKYVYLTGKFVPIPYDDIIPMTKNSCRVPKLFMDIIYKSEIKIHHVSHLTNCLNGQFHKWTTKDKNFTCVLCNTSTNEIDNKNDDTICDKFNYNILSNMSKIKCSSDGKQHIFLKTETNKTCSKCGNSYDHDYTETELNKLKEIMITAQNTNISDRYEKNNKIIEENKKNYEYNKKVIENVKKHFNNDIKYNFINELINEIQIQLGNETTEYNLNNNTYIIDHDHLGQQLAKPIILTGESKIMYKKNHPFFNTNVIYYTNTKVGKIDVFYNANTKILIGYKEQDKQYITSNINNRKNIVVKYSIFNKIKYLGLQSQYINVEQDYNKLLARDNLLDKNKIFDNLVYDIIKNRTHNLKNILTTLKTSFQKIINNNNKQISLHDETQYFSNIYALFIEKYKNKMNNIKFDYEKHNVFKHWKGIVRGCNDYKEHILKFDKIMMIDCDDLITDDENGNIILFYIFSELTQLLKINTNKIMKTTISNFIIDFVNFAFDSYNTENDLNNIDIKRFNYVVSSEMYLDVGTDIIVEEVYNEVKMTDELSEEMEQKIDEIEEMDAIDMEENEDSDAMSDGYESN